ncbi:MAG: NTP transferase domain-containing protein [Oscillospiraceae bacterium]|nr:NTP transferase domain-containing protein [Oscillospiraceae bacterium]
MSRTPKPLIPVGDLPIMEHIMRQFRQYGCTEFHGIVNYKKQLIKAYFSENEEHFNTIWYDEDKPLGTGGGLNLLKGKLSGTFFLTNCDLLIFTDYEKLLRFHRESGSAVTMVCAEKRVTIPYGVVETGEGGVITAMREKPAFQFLTNTGLYLVEPEVLDDIGEDEVIGFPDIIERQRRKGRRVSAYTVGEEDWLDMGQLDELEKMRERLYGKP